MRKDALVDVDKIFAKDMKDPEFLEAYESESNKLESALAVRLEREEYGWTQRELADKAGIPQSTVARIESGANTSIDTMSKIGLAFGKSIKISFV
ncbi:helix-turn-helix transcriptional regulator [Lactobacillus sp. ESL0791]|uniref:helix-turn-helix transcriptional regulator n=1 Tax=Lactobacillus sp. ESL0791 TaxID=2983234 RepID=UPI0023F83B9F|nr:helix-turn-helix transcriptional regulator [Lactobacillus sp. ESL0791]MDF7638032.1 helix-turn-helix transcriptional regulator [Lactobacillus sp. ESL0791]